MDTCQVQDLLFSDESHFILSRLAPNCLQDVERLLMAMHWWGLESIMVVRSLLYVRQVQHHVIPGMSVNGGMFQHDNARPHAARISQEFLQRHNVQTWPWPARSLDVNPTEHVCDALDRVYARHVLRHCIMRAKELHNVLYTCTFDCCHASPLSNCHQGSWWS